MDTKTVSHKESSHRNPTFRAWAHMIDRCSNPRTQNYRDYGGRGIYVCERWKKFRNFAFDMGPRPDGLTLERIRNDGPYSPGNCIWATRKAQARNRRSSRFVQFGKEVITLAEAAERSGIMPMTLAWRLNSGWKQHDAVTKPVRVRPRRATRVSL